MGNRNSINQTLLKSGLISYSTWLHVFLYLFDLFQAEMLMNHVAIGENMREVAAPQLALAFLENKTSQHSWRDVHFISSRYISKISDGRKK